MRRGNVEPNLTSLGYFVVLLNCFIASRIILVPLSLRSAIKKTPLLDAHVSLSLTHETLSTSDTNERSCALKLSCVPSFGVVFGVVLALEGCVASWIVNDRVSQRFLADETRETLNGIDQHKATGRRRPGPSPCETTLWMPTKFRASVRRQLDVSHYCRCYFQNTRRRHRDISDTFG